ncbi:MAG TPA: DUF1573 domain-containing protein [Saprospiraceae bacterium]|nr:DUF1573 domain-containing protein [Saprospiraceae bacterium]HPQ22375.1 DUF1573 domain-containing protein [Saprospiraceae bacterium]HRX28798.1 DUF1573 domain-containing protein [Saprospiraceae bacterium]
MTSCKNKDAAAAAENSTTESLATTSTDASTMTTAPQTPPTEAVPVGPLTTMVFDEMEYDFGKIMDGDKATHMYKFTNTGKEPLVISNAKGSCGCTVPEWPREPIAPGAKGEIKVVFDSRGKGKVGGQMQTKTVTLTANTDPQTTTLRIKGMVDKNAEDATAPAAH